MPRRTTGVVTNARVVTPEDLIADSRLSNTAQDLLDHTAIARAVAEIALSAEAPVNIALFGPWGSGKSSIYTMVKEHVETIAPASTRVVRYDAWKYGGQSLKRNFLISTAKELGLKDERFGVQLQAPRETNDLAFWSWVRRNKASLALGATGAFAIAALWVLGLALPKALLNDIDFAAAVRSTMPTAGTVFGLALIALLVGPKVIEGAVVRVTTTPPSADDEFSDRFTDLIKAVTDKGAERLIVFIDELDRCSPEDVVSTLVDLKTFLDQEHCVFIVAADREVIERALRKVPQAKPLREEVPYYATPGAFLDKIFQHQIALPPLRPRALTKFAHSLVGKQGGIWGEMRELDIDLFESVIFALVPIHVQSPRRVKVLLNNYATNARITEARGLPWVERAQEIAVLTVLQTEFPSVARDLLRIPRLLTFMLGAEPATSEEARAALQRYGAPYVREAPIITQPSPETDDEGGDNVGQSTAAGNLLTDEFVDRASALEAADTLNRQLAAYLAKVDAGQIGLPRPDLFYLQTAGHVDGLLDAHLGDLVDFATDTAPDTVVAAFAHEPSAVLGVAVRLLVIQAEGASGPGTDLALESACRLVEAMDEADIRGLVADVAPTALAVRPASHWRDGAIPGATRLAAASGSVKVGRELIGRVAAMPLPGGLLTRVAGALTASADTELEALAHRAFVPSYAVDPKPLEEALASFPRETAGRFWAALSAHVLETLVVLEAPPAPVEPVAPVPAGTARPAGSTTPAVPETSAPTGEGRLRLRGLLSAAESRGDGETLVSAMLTMAQGCNNQEVRNEALVHAGRLLGQFADRDLARHHVLVGMLTASDDEWLAWAGLFEPPVVTTKDPDAGSVLTERLLPAVGSASSQVELAQLKDLVASVAKLVVDGGAAQVQSAVARMFANLPWDSETSADDEEVFTHRRRTAHGIARSLVDLIGPEACQDFLARDISTGVATVELDDTTQNQLCDLIDDLDPGTAEALEGLLSEYTPKEDERVPLLRLRVRARLRYHGAALAAEEMTGLDDDNPSSSVVRDWLTLNPSVSDVIALIPRVSIHPTWLGSYTIRLSTSERSLIWISLDATHVSDAGLAAVGSHGVDDSVVRYMADRIIAAPRQHDRDRLVERLMTAAVLSQSGDSSGRQGGRSQDLDASIAARRAGNELARDLLATRIAGDARLAARLVLWTGGAVHGYVVALRALFDEAAEQKTRPFPPPTLRELSGLGLLTPQKKGPLAKLLRS